MEIETYVVMLQLQSNLHGLVLMCLGTSTKYAVKSIFCASWPHRAHLTSGLNGVTVNDDSVFKYPSLRWGETILYGQQLKQLQNKLCLPMKMN